MRGVAYNTDFDSGTFLLSYAIENEIKPTDRFCKLAGDFKNRSYAMHQANELPDGDVNKYNQFYRIYKEWRKHFELNGDDLREEHPWKQYKDSQQTGIERMKNNRSRRMWKPTHVVAKLNPTYLKRTHDKKLTENQSTETSLEDPDKNGA